MMEFYTSHLHRAGYRMTPQRMTILRILNLSNSHMTPQEICQQAQEALPGLTEATVYRTLNFLAGQGLILSAHVGGGQMVYEAAHRDHHHLICRKCGRTHEVDHKLLESLYKQFQRSTGYKIDGMHVTFFGLCPICQSDSAE